MAGIAYLGQGSLITSTTTQSTPSFVLRDHADYGGLGIGGTVRMEMGDPRPAGKSFIKAAGTSADGLKFESAGGIVNSAAGTVLLTSSTEVMLSARTLFFPVCCAL